MTDIAMSRSPADGRTGTAQTAKDEAKNVAQTAQQAGGEVLSSASAQGREVADEARRQARNLYGQASGELRQQAGAQQRRAAGGLRAVGDEIRTMASQGGGSGTATELAHRASDKVAQVADWLENREPGQVVDEVKRYARQHPGAFLAGAALLGVLAGRLTRNIAAESGAGTGADTTVTGDRRADGPATGPGVPAGVAGDAAVGTGAKPAYVDPGSDPAAAYGDPGPGAAGYRGTVYPPGASAPLADPNVEARP